MWDTELRKGATFDIQSLGSVDSSVRSIFWDAATHTVLIGTRGAEIFEMADTDGSDINERPLMAGHYAGNLDALAVPSQGDEVATGGHDATLRLWDSKTHRMLRMVALQAPIQCLAYSPDMKRVVVSIGMLRNNQILASKNGTPIKEGTFMVLKHVDLSVVHQAADAKKAITCVMYSPDGSALACGSADGIVYIYSTLDDSFELLCRCEGHIAGIQPGVEDARAKVLHVDFDITGDHIRSNDDHGNLCFHSTVDGSVENVHLDIRNYDWHTSTCPMSWEAGGCWYDAREGIVPHQQILAVDRSPDGQLLASGDNCGIVGMRFFPCPLPQHKERKKEGGDNGDVFIDKFNHISQRAQVSIGHSAHVSNIKFASSGIHLFTAGGQDKCLCQWFVEPASSVIGAVAPGASTDEVADNDDAPMLPDVLTIDHDPTLAYYDAASVQRKRSILFHTAKSETSFFEMSVTPKGTSATPDEEDLNTAAPDDNENVDNEKVGPQPWLEHAISPSDPAKADPLEPLDKLELDFIHGYSTTASRNNLRYTVDEGVIVYPAAGVGVIYNIPKKVQKFNLSHTDSITALTVNLDGTMVATGQQHNDDAKVVIWDARTGETIYELKGVHSDGVSHVAFSDEGRLFLSVGMDAGHSMALRNVLDNFRLMGSVQIGQVDIYAAHFCPEGSRFTMCTAGDKTLCFWKVQGRNFKATQAFLGSKLGTWQPFLCLGTLDSDILAGTLDGHLYRFRKHRLRVSIKAHQAPLLSMSSVPGKGIASGAQDGSIRLWNSDLECFAEFNTTKQLDSISPAVRSLCWRPISRRLLVGTAGAEIFEIDDKTGACLHKHGAVMNGHHEGSVRGLAVHPSQQECCTVGSDKTVRIWDLVDARLIMQAEMEAGMSCAAYSPDAKLIAVGMGVREIKEKMSGFIMILKCDNLLEVHRAQDSLQFIADIKFSPDGETLAVGSSDGAIYLYDVHLEWNLRATFTKSLGAICHLDFDTNSEFIQNSDAANDIYFSNAADGKHIVEHSALKDIAWSTWTLNVGWPVRGLAQVQDGQPSVNCTCRSKDQMLVVAGDNFGNLRLFNHPCLEQDALHRTYRGHASSVTNTRFTLNDEYVVTTGGTDLCVFQWKVKFEDPDVGLQNAADTVRGAPVCAEPALSLQHHAMHKQEARQAAALRSAGTGDVQTSDVRPWERAIVIPSNVDPASPAAPTHILELEFVYGFNGCDARGSISYNAAGNIVYHTGGVGVIYDKREHRQVFNNGVHSADISCLVLDPTRRYVATSQAGESPVVQLWDAASGASIARFERVHQRGVTCLAFSPDGRQLASVGVDDSHRVAVFQSRSGAWHDGRLRAHAAGDTKEVLFCTWTKHKDPDAYDLVTGGVSHCKFWRAMPGSPQLDYSSGIFGASAKIQTLTCGASIDQTVVTGTVSGDFYIWEGRKCVSVIATAHDGCVNCLYTHDNQSLLSGSADGTIKVWTDGMQLKKTMSVKDVEVPSKNSEVRSVCVDPVTNTVLVGTRGCEIYEFFARGQTLIVDGHAEGELWGLDCNPRHPSRFVSVGDDQTVRLWDMEQRLLIRTLKGDCAMRAVSFSGDGGSICVGMGGGPTIAKKEGAFMVLQADDGLTLLHEGRPAKRAITDVSFSPNGRLVALTSADSKVYLHDCKDFDKQAVCDAHKDPVMHVDFSSDSKHLQTTCTGHELKFFDTIAGRELTSPSKLKGVEWSSQHCIYGWQVQGIWKTAAGNVKPAPEVHAVDRSPDGSLIVSGDSLGRVILRRFPSVEEDHGIKVGLGHAGKVANVRFSQDGKRVLSAGGDDRAIFQWKLRKL